MVAVQTLMVKDTLKKTLARMAVREQAGNNGPQRGSRSNSTCSNRRELANESKDSQLPDPHRQLTTPPPRVLSPLRCRDHSSSSSFGLRTLFSHRLCTVYTADSLSFCLGT